jgi:hypothetical protein
MRRSAIAAAIAAVLQLYPSAAGQSQTATSQALAVASDIDPEPTGELKRIEQSFGSAIERHDAEALERFVAPEFTLRVADIPQGSLPRAIWIDNSVNKLKGAKFLIRYSAARKLADDLAVAIEVHESQGTIDGREQGCVCSGVDFWKKRGGAWQIVARYNIWSNRRRDRNSGPVPPSTDVDPSLTDTLRQLEQELAGAALRGYRDATQIDRLVAADFTLRTMDAPEKIVSREQWKEAGRSNPPLSTEEQFHAARGLANDLAVVSFLLTEKARSKSRDLSGTSYVVDIWKERSNRWQLIARYSGKTFEPMPR